MKFQFKIQPYQTQAVAAVVDVFKGQPFEARVRYRHDVGVAPVVKVSAAPAQMELGLPDESALPLEYELGIGHRNAGVMLQEPQLLANIHHIQREANIKLSPKLDKNFGACCLDVEMETGTGKTYVYIKTMLELNRQYGWSKFIVVVPSIAIREGVKKSLEMTSEHFMAEYGKKARFFIYNSKELPQLDSFATGSGLQVMIINTQAFNTSLKEGGRSKEARIIYDQRDEFASRRPIDVIRATRPILILDEPQKISGKQTLAALQNFNPLFALHYSATHTTMHNLVYVLDALDAYQKRLVKKIEVKGFELQNLKGTDCYLYFKSLETFAKKAPQAMMELEVKQANAIVHRSMRLKEGDDLYVLSNNLEAYRGLTIAEIDPLRQSLRFTSGLEMRCGEVRGDVTESNLRRLQIQETIRSHFAKEAVLFERGIKTLSLFFIDKVEKYRAYSEAGEEVLSEYARMFEEEYRHIYEEQLTLFENTKYQRYLREFCCDPHRVHQGYFSVDKKGRSIDSKENSKDDVNVYDLIMKDKEALLSFAEPTRFIFSHSALREGWDNPNIFQICALKHSDSKITKRQEVGRGLRLCVDYTGKRMDREEDCGCPVHELNRLTLITAEGYTDFVKALQDDMRESLYDRVKQIAVDYFVGKRVERDGTVERLTAEDSRKIYHYLVRHGYLDDEEHLTAEYHDAVAAGSCAPLPEGLQAVASDVHQLIDRVQRDELSLEHMVDDGRRAVVDENPLNANFYKKEFQTLWKELNHKYRYCADLDSEELIQNAVMAINAKLVVAQLSYTMHEGVQKDDMQRDDLASSHSFADRATRNIQLQHAEVSSTSYDLIGKLVESTKLTRLTIARILQAITPAKFALYPLNPESFIIKTAKLINEQKAAVLVRNIRYDVVEGSYETDIFNLPHGMLNHSRAFRANKHVQDYVLVDGDAECSVEGRFARALDKADEVAVYAKLPRHFYIPTPFGRYSPDWAIAFVEGTVKHLYFVAETKGSTASLDLRPIERAKIDCAKILMKKVTNAKIHFHDVTSYQELLDKIRGEPIES